MTNKQPEALRIADAFGIPHWTGLPIALHVEAAAELRRLHEVNAELVERIKNIVECCGNVAQETKVHLDAKQLAKLVIKDCKAALAKSQRDNNE